jgi:hypothetical protein
MKVSFRTLKYHEIFTLSIVSAKPGHMAGTWLILALTSFRSLGLILVSIHSLPPNDWSCGWASRVSVRSFTPRLLMNGPKASCMSCALHGLWLLNAGQPIAVDSSVDGSSCVDEWFEEASSVVISWKPPLVCSTPSITCLIHSALQASVFWPLTYHRLLTLNIVKEHANTLSKSELNI